MLGVLRQVKPIDFPEGEYAVSPELPLTISFVSPSTIMIRASSRFEARPDQESLMLVNGKAPEDRNSWKYSKIPDGHKYTSPHGSVIIDGSVIPHIALAQSTAQMDWSTLNLVIYSTDSEKVSGFVCLPSDNALHTLNLVKKGESFSMEKDPYSGIISWKTRLYSK
jgi:hypothetical protein